MYFSFGRIQEYFATMHSENSLKIVCYYKTGLKRDKGGYNWEPGCFGYGFKNNKIGG